jgi:hypothetical protein
VGKHDVMNVGLLLYASLSTVRADTSKVPTNDPITLKATIQRRIAEYLIEEGALVEVEGRLVYCLGFPTDNGRIDACYTTPTFPKNDRLALQRRGEPLSVDIGLDKSVDFLLVQQEDESYERVEWIDYHYIEGEELQRTFTDNLHDLGIYLGLIEPPIITAIGEMKHTPTHEEIYRTERLW